MSGIRELSKKCNFLVNEEACFVPAMVFNLLGLSIHISAIFQLQRRGRDSKTSQSHAVMLRLEERSPRKGYVG